LLIVFLMIDNLTGVRCNISEFLFEFPSQLRMLNIYSYVY
jgi:hypothetical protein